MALTQKQYQKYLLLFQDFDVDEDGVITKEEFIAGLVRQQPSLRPHAEVP